MFFFNQESNHISSGPVVFEEEDGELGGEPEERPAGRREGQEQRRLDGHKVWRHSPVAGGERLLLEAQGRLGSSASSPFLRFCLKVIGHVRFSFCSHMHTHTRVQLLKTHSQIHVYVCLSSYVCITQQLTTDPYLATPKEFFDDYAISFNLLFISLQLRPHDYP